MQTSFNFKDEMKGNIVNEETLSQVSNSPSVEENNQIPDSSFVKESISTPSQKPQYYEPQQIKYLKNDTLHLNLKNLIPFERQVTHQILIHILEVDRRSLHLEMAYSSLWDYLVNGLSYSSASAQRRIEAARLMRQVPDLGQKLEEGVINFSQVSLLQKTIRDIKKQKDQKVTAEIKQDIIKKLENKSKKETDQIIAEAFQIEPETKEIHKTQKDKSLKVEMTFTEQEAEMLEWAKLQLSHSLLKSESLDLKGLFLYTVRKVIKSKVGVQV